MKKIFKKVLGQIKLVFIGFVLCVELYHELVFKGKVPYWIIWMVLPIIYVIGFVIGVVQAIKTKQGLIDIFEEAGKEGYEMMEESIDMEEWWKN